MRKIDKTGEFKINNQGLKMTIVGYVNANNIDVEFEDGFVVTNRQYGDFKKGTIKNPYYPEVCGIGFIGVGKYMSRKNGKQTNLYTTWQHMLKRCYSERLQEKRPTYKGCEVCNEWHNYQNFAKWFEENIWSEDCTVLDKDILVKGNKIYSPQTCILVDNRINSLFTKRDRDRGKYPIGISYNKRDKKFQTNCSATNDGKNKSKYLGYYNTYLEAFKHYKDFKENYIKQVTDEYKSKYTNFPNKLYKAMYDYKVEIDD